MELFPFGGTASFSNDRKTTSEDTMIFSSPINKVKVQEQNLKTEQPPSSNLSDTEHMSEML